MKQFIYSMILTGLLIEASLSLFSQDRLFTYTYQSTVLTKGQREIEIWNTLRLGRGDYYARLDNRTEFEIGLGKNLQTAFYLNLTTKTQTVEEMSQKTLEKENSISISNEWKYKFSDPVADPLGFALYGEYGIGSDEYELEGKIILDKKLKDFFLAGNLIYELELEPGLEENETDWENEHKADMNIALAYSFNLDWHITTEHSFKNVFEEGNWEHSAIYSGLGFSHMMDNFWINFTAMPQIVSFKGETNSSLNLNEFEKIQFRLLFSYVF